MTEKRKESDGNYGIWRSALKYLKSFSKADVKFSDINKQWLDDLKYYFVNDARTKHTQKLSRNSCSSYFNKVRAALKEATKDGYILRNPADDIEVKQKENFSHSMNFKK